MTDGGPSSPQPDSADHAWVMPGKQGTPAQAMVRIQAICREVPDAYTALSIIQATHQGVSRDILAMVIKPCRTDLDDLSVSDISALISSIWHGGKAGFDSVLRSRRKGGKKAALSWVAD